MSSRHMLRNIAQEWTILSTAAQAHHLLGTSDITIINVLDILEKLNY